MKTIVPALALSLLAAPVAAQTASLEGAWRLCLDAVQTNDTAAALARTAPAKGFQQVRPGQFGANVGGMTVVLMLTEDDYGDPVCAVRNNATERDALIARGAAFWRAQGFETDTRHWLWATRSPGLVVTIHKPNEFFETSVSMEE